jgi:cold shock CspA family protein
MNTERGFGFIIGDDGAEHFFHSSKCLDWECLAQRDRVTFDLGTNEKTGRAMAIDVRLEKQNG